MDRLCDFADKNYRTNLRQKSEMVISGTPGIPQSCFIDMGLPLPKLFDCFSSDFVAGSVTWSGSRQNVKTTIAEIWKTWVKNWPIPASFYLFSSFSHYNFNNTNWKNCDGVLGIWTRGGRIVSADKTTEQWHEKIVSLKAKSHWVMERDVCLQNFGIFKHFSGSPEPIGQLANIR